MGSFQKKQTNKKPAPRNKHHVQGREQLGASHYSEILPGPRPRGSEHAAQLGGFRDSLHSAQRSPRTGQRKLCLIAVSQPYSVRLPAKFPKWLTKTLHLGCLGLSFFCVGSTSRSGPHARYATNPELKSLPGPSGLRPARATSGRGVATCVESVLAPAPHPSTLPPQPVLSPSRKHSEPVACHRRGGLYSRFKCLPKRPNSSPQSNHEEALRAAFQAARRDEQTASWQPLIFRELPQYAPRCRQRSCRV